MADRTGQGHFAGRRAVDVDQPHRHTADGYLGRILQDSVFAIDAKAFEERVEARAEAEHQ